MNSLRIPEVFISLLRSRRFIAVGAKSPCIATGVSALVMVLVVAIPQLAPLEDGLVSVIVAVILTLLEVPMVI